MTAAVSHARKLWGDYWVLPAGLPLVYAAVMWAVGDLRPEHIIIPLVAGALAYATPKTKAFFLDVVPYLAVGFGYDLVRYARLITQPRVLGCGLREFELSLFSVAPGVTVQDYFAAHHHPTFDVLFAVPYAIFVYVAIGYAAYLYFKDRQRMRHYLWAFMIANFISFAMWMIVPAAPPWYLRAAGCSIDLSAAPSAGSALLRVDAMFGMDYFQRFYSRTASVYGAMPSMHCAYPMLGLLTAWKKATWRTRPIHIVYTLLMISAAVYLDHHWIVDGLAGWSVALVATLLARRLLIALGLWQTPPESAPAAPVVVPTA